MKKRGQAAMEFLMTYGWAILAAVIVVGVLWYLIGDPSALAGNKFVMSSTEGILHNAMSLDATANEIVLEVRNGQAETITVTAIAIGSLCSSAPGTDIIAGELGAFTISSCAMTSGDRINEDVTFSFTTPGSSVSQTSSGTITGKVP